MKRMANLLSQITFKWWLLFLFMSQAVYSLMLIYSIPRISHEAGGLLLFDMKPLGYSYEYAHQFLSQLSQKGYELYTHVQIPLDLLYPVLFCLTGLCTIALLFRLEQNMTRHPNATLNSAYTRIAFSIPLVAMFADYLENILIFAMLSYQTAVPKTLVLAANGFTLIKSISTAAFYMLVIFLVVRMGLIWIGKMTKGGQTGGKFWSKGEKSGTFESINNGRNAPTAKNETAQ